MTKYLTFLALVLGVAFGMSAPASAAERYRDRSIEQERYVPASDDIIDFLFGGPRYYDQQLFTTAAGPCAYDRTGPDGNAANMINGHYCGK
ncbi:hypothetical protein [Mesorhizobium sp.]|uniref:hypothetical protein n=1 Tax=Mesorhizobium sp. TaxID=1871066 RepID=UPI0025FE8AA5|nr:hypothetical protein [Mesorhizobium sp.]